MKITITVYGNPPAEIVRIARHAEDLGFHGISVGDHVAIPVGYKTEYPYPGQRENPGIVGDAADHHFDSWVMIGQLIGATKRIAITSGVTIAALRHPLVQLRAATTALELAPERFSLGLGSGWLKEEYQALGVDFSRRGDRLDEFLDIFDKALAGGPFSHEGHFYRFAPVQMVSHPVRMPIVFGGSNPKAIRRSALRGDGWVGPSDCGLADCIRIRGEIEAMRAEAGKQGPFACIPKLQTPASSALLAAYAEAGFDTVVLPWNKIFRDRPAADNFSDRLRALDQVAQTMRQVAR